jgi:NhaP-type Na+/H+ or K+/H+ antiporter
VTLSDALFLAAGVGLLLAAFLPRALEEVPFSTPLVFLGAGLAFGLMPIGPLDIDPVESRAAAEHVTEVVVIIALMGAGLALNRPPSWRAWSSTWRLLGIAMPLTIALIAVAAAIGLGWPFATALLLGAVLAPTDPVLASDVQVAEPVDADDDGATEESDDEVRFALTSEAGLNDGLAFPFVYAAVAAATTSGASWVAGWAADDLLFKITVGVVVGLVVGLALGRVFFRAPIASLRFAEHADGFVALGATALAYGVAEVAHGYGFIAVFVTACTIRASERSHGYHGVLHGFVEQVERLLTAWLLLLLGSAIANGILSSLTWRSAAVGIAVIFLVRPLSGWLAQLGGSAGRSERQAIAFFGIRGIGSFYYLAYATGQADFGPHVDELWAVVAFVVLVSVVVHGITATPVMRRLDAARHRTATAETGDRKPPAEDTAAQHP